MRVNDIIRKTDDDGVGAGPPPIGGLGNFPRSLGVCSVQQVLRLIPLHCGRLFATGRDGTADALAYLDLRPRNG